MRPSWALPTIALFVTAAFVFGSVAAAGSAIRTDTLVGAGSGTVPKASHVVVIVLENKGRSQIVGNREAPNLTALARRYAQLTNYTAVAHPSLPNYLALVSGSTHGITSDCTDCLVAASNLANTIEKAGKSWKTYAEGLPFPGFTGSSAGRYRKKHVPFLYFRNVVDNPRRLARVVSLGNFSKDLRSGRLPGFSLVVPDLCHDMHDCSVATGDTWLGSFVKPLLSNQKLGRLVVYVVFDEGNDDVGGGGHVQALALGPLVRPGARDAQPLNHYSLLRTIELSLGLRALRASADANPVLGIWLTRPA